MTLAVDCIQCDAQASMGRRNLKDAMMTRSRHEDKGELSDIAGMRRAFPFPESCSQTAREIIVDASFT